MELRSRLSRKIEIDQSRFCCSFSGISFSKPASIKFYGNRQKGLLSEIDPSVTKEQLKEFYGLDGFPELDIQSVEVIILSFEDGRKLSFHTSENGFTVNFFRSDDDELIKEEYLRTFDGQKHIVLHFEVH